MILESIHDTLAGYGIILGMPGIIRLSQESGVMRTTLYKFYEVKGRNILFPVNQTGLDNSVLKGLRTFGVKSVLYGFYPNS